MSTRPSGTISFLFTDIEGSTRLWAGDPETMKESLARHASILRDAVDTHDGSVFKHTGDGMCSVFSLASDAVGAALNAQRSLAREDWAADCPIRARMAIHSGQAEERDGDYFGPFLNHVARLMSTAHGGQVLLSTAAAGLVHDHLPDEVALLNLGTHRLRDLSRQENVFQLLHPDLERRFPPIRSLNRFVGNLPEQLTSFVGREEEIEKTCELFDAARLLTLTGIGGAGKTRLEAYPDGVWFVELAPVVDPSRIGREVASVFEVAEDGLSDFLRGKSVLIILDNCEHLLDSCAQLVHRLLQLGPDVQVLATSREALGVPGEVVRRVPSLSTPESGDDAAESLLTFEAIRLFIERAIAVQPGFTLTVQNAAAVSQITRRLDGIPLAIELAAARTNALSPDQIASRLDDRFRLLTGGSRTALPRQRTLQAAIEWSYQLLSGDEARLFNRLSVFRGGFTLEAAEHVGASKEVDRGDVIDLLLQLVDKSMVAVAHSGPEGAARYDLLETLRQYAGERLADSGEAEEARRLHAACFAEMTHEIQTLLWGENSATALHRLAVDHDNLRAALGWSLESGAAETALRLVGDLAYFWMVHRHVTEGNEWAERALSTGEDVPSDARAQALISAGMTAMQQMDYDRATARLEESLKLYRELGNAAGVARAAFFRGAVPWFEGDLERAEPLLEQAAELNQRDEDLWTQGWRRHLLSSIAASHGDYEDAHADFERKLDSHVRRDDPLGRSFTLLVMGSLARNHADYTRAATHFEESIPFFRALGDGSGVAAALDGLATVAWIQGERERALTLQQESMREYKAAGDKASISWAVGNLRFGMRTLGDLEWALQLYDERRELAPDVGAKSGIAESLYSLGRLARQRGDLDRAAALLRDSLGLHQETGQRRGSAQALLETATLARLQSDPTRAVRLLGSAEAAGDAATLTGYEQSEFAAATADLLGSLDHETFTRLHSEGKATPLDEAVAYALQGLNR